MLKSIIEKINSAITKEGYEKYTNEWNIANQLIDILAVSGDDAIEIVNRDLDIEGMSVPALVKEIKNKRIRNPEQVMKNICDFYKINPSSALPPEHWRNGQDIRPKKTDILSSVAGMSLIDLL